MTSAPVKNQVNFDTHTKTNKSIDTHANNKLFSARAQKSSQCSPPHKNKSISMPTFMLNQFWPPTQKQSQFQSLHWIRLNLDKPHHNQINLFLHWNQAKQFYPPHRSQVNFDQPLLWYLRRPSITFLRVFPGFIARPFRGMGVGFEEPHLRLMF